MTMRLWENGLLQENVADVLQLLDCFSSFRCGMRTSGGVPFCEFPFDLETMRLRCKCVSAVSSIQLTHAHSHVAQATRHALKTCTAVLN